MRLIKGADLTHDQKKEVKSTFVNWHLDTTVTSFEQWLSAHAFYITKEGHIAKRPRYCEPAFMVLDYPTP